MNFKRTVSLITGLMMAVLFMPVAYAETEIKTTGEYEYYLNNNGEVCLETYVGNETNIVIPDEIEGNIVTELGETFATTDVESVTLNSTIEDIDKNAFINCYSLSEIIVPDENENFCSEDGVLFTGDMTIMLCYPSAKQGTSYEIPEGVTEIGIAAIYDTLLEKITFPESLEYIDRHGVSYNQRLKEADLSETVLTAVGEMSFAGDTSLVSVQFPDTLYEIDGGAFAQCSSLQSVELPPNLGIVGQNAFAGSGLTEITIPSTVESIGYCAFGYDENLEPVDGFIVKGESGSMAQTYATDTDEEYEYSNNFTFQATDAEVYEELEGTPYGDFEYAEVDGEAYITFCDQTLKDVEIPSEIEGLPVTVVYGGAFYQSEVETIKFPDTLKRIEIMAFCDCDSLKSVDIPEGTEEIMAQAFYECSELTEINIPASCIEIGDNAFAACPKLTAINITEGNTAYKSVDGVLFNADGTEIIRYPDGKSDSYKIPDNVKTVADYAFSENANIKKVDINNAETIGIDAFSFCDNLIEVKMNNKVKTIGDYAFYECLLLEKIEFSKSLETVGAYALYQCPLITSVRLGDNITEIGECSFGYVYDETTGENEAVEGFKIYADEDTGGAGYAETCGFELISGTVAVGNLNIDKIFLMVSGGIVLIVILSTVTLAVLKKKKNKDNPER